MQRKRIISIVLLCAIAALVVAYAFFANRFLMDISVPYDSSQNPVNIVFRFGVMGRNELNTFNGTFTKDLVIDGTITTRLILSQEELAQVQQKLVDIGFFDYPEAFPSQGVVTPRADFYIKAVTGSAVKEVSWYSDSAMDTKTETDLSQLANFLTEMIEEKPAYKMLPPANGAYC